jgi:hypothetical protein
MMINLPNQITHADELPHPLVTEPMSSDWKSRINENQWWAQDFTATSTLTDIELPIIKVNKTLIRKILAFGGEEVCMPLKEWDLELIMTRGVLLYGHDARFFKGEPCECHRNSALYWEKNKEKVVLMTGYALSNDSMWRQHSWCAFIKSGKVIESTKGRKAYFGFAMTRDEANAFLDENA